MRNVNRVSNSCKIGLRGYDISGRSYVFRVVFMQNSCKKVFILFYFILFYFILLHFISFHFIFFFGNIMYLDSLPNFVIFIDFCA